MAPLPRHIRNPAVVLPALVILAAAFNLTKAVHIDDTAYLDTARWIVGHPLSPLSGILHWEEVGEPAYVQLNQPPLHTYLLAGVMWVFGESELALHAYMAVMSALAILLFHQIAGRLVPRYSLLLTTLLVTSPAFLPGQNLMTDVPTLVAWLVCMKAVLRAGTTQGSFRWYAIAGASIAAACLTKYGSLSLIPLLFFSVVYRRHWRALWAVGIPIAALVLWSMWNYLDYGGVHLFGRLNRVNRLGPMDLWFRSIAWVGCAGLAVPAGVLLFATSKGTGFPRVVLGIGFSAAIMAFLAGRNAPPHEIQSAVLWAFFIWVGVTTLMAASMTIAREFRSTSKRDRDEAVVLALWVGAAAGLIVLAPMMAMRHLLPLTPALLLLAGKAIGQLPTRRAMLASAAAVTGALGVTIAAADYAYADVYRRQPEVIARTLSAQVPRTWVVGHWGWQWYAGRQGWVVYDKLTSDVRTGDLIITATNVIPQEIRPEDRARMHALAYHRVPPSGLTYLRTFRTNPWGGYYTSPGPGGAFPMSYSTGIVETFIVFRVVR